VAKNLFEKPLNKSQEETSRARNSTNRRGIGWGYHTNCSHTPPPQHTEKPAIPETKKQPAGKKNPPHLHQNRNPRTATLSTKNTHRDPKSTRKINMD
jgi:hypothetical protein